MAEIEQNEVQQSTINDDVITATTNSSNDPAVTTAAQPAQDWTSPSCSGIISYTGWTKKVNPKCSTHNVIKYWPILKILSLLQSPENLQRSGH